MAVDGGNKDKEQGMQTACRFVQHVMIAQGDKLPDSRAYLNGCSMVTAFKTRKHLRNIRMEQSGAKINCNNRPVQ